MLDRLGSERRLSGDDRCKRAISTAPSQLFHFVSPYTGASPLCSELVRLALDLVERVSLIGGTISISRWDARDALLADYDCAVARKMAVCETGVENIVNVGHRAFRAREKC